MSRILRSRLIDQAELRDSGYSPPSHGTPVLIGQVYDGGNMPTSGDHYFACHPVEIDGDPCEGCPGTIVVDTSSTVFVDVIGNRLPRVGDLLECYFVGGRWLAESRSGCSAKFCLACVGDPVSGATITIKDPATNETIATGTTGVDGCVTLTIGLAGSYKVRASAPGHVAVNPLRSISCGDTVNLEICTQTCSLCTLPAVDLVLSLPTDNGAPVEVPMLFQTPTPPSTLPTWLGTASGQLFTMKCIDPGGWQLEITYNDTVNGGTATCDLALLGDCDTADLVVNDITACVNLTASTHYILPFTITE